MRLLLTLCTKAILQTVSNMYTPIPSFPLGVGLDNKLSCLFTQSTRLKVPFLHLMLVFHWTGCCVLEKVFKYASTSDIILNVTQT